MATARETLTPSFPVERGEGEVRFVQAVRVLDVVAIGPAMVWGAVAARRLPMPVRVFLGASGILTVLFNGYRFLRVFRAARGRVASANSFGLDCGASWPPR